MGDYVLESNPALERLIERLRAPDETELPEEPSCANDDEATRFRRRRSKVHSAGRPEGFRTDPIRATVVVPPALTGPEDAPSGAENELWAAHRGFEPTDELILVGFDEEPEIFDEDLGELDEDETDEPDEFFDLSEDEDEDSEETVGEEYVVVDADELLLGDPEDALDGDTEVAEDEELVLGEADVTLDDEDEILDEADAILDEGDETLAQDEEDVEDEASVEIAVPVWDAEPDDDDIADEDDEDIVDEERDVLDDDDEELAEDDDIVAEDGNELGDWILSAFEAWRIESLRDGAEQDDEDLATDEEDLEALDEVRADASVDAEYDEYVDDEEEDEDDDLIEVLDEDTDDLVAGARPLHEEFERILLESPTGHDEPDHPALVALSSQLSANAGRKKARHKKQSPRQKKRSLRKAEQDARKVQKSSLKAAAKAAKTPAAPHLSHIDFRAEAPIGAMGVVARR